MLNFAPICHIHAFQSKVKNIAKFTETLAKQGNPGQNKEKQNNDKNTRNACGDSFHLPRQYFPQTLKTLNLSYVLDSKGTFY